MTPIEAVPTWVLAYVVIFVLFHLVIGYYIYRRSEQLGVSEGTLSADSAVDANTAGTDFEGHSTGESVIQCGHCNASNDPSYRYCRDCIQELPSMAGQSLSTETPEERESL